MKITKKIFKEKTGHNPVDDDLERCNCNLVGAVGHSYCGWCDKHDLPRFVCGCDCFEIDLKNYNVLKVNPPIRIAEISDIT